MTCWVLAALALLLTAAGALLWRLGRIEQKYDKPIALAATLYSVDPALVKAIIWRESRFRPAAHGAAGELGLMQLQEIAAQEWAYAERNYTFEHEHCLDPLTNILAGTFYLSTLLQRYQDADDAVPYALADYNAGRGNVVRWIDGEAATNSSKFMEGIGFPGTKDYVRDVMRRAKCYR